MATNLSVGCGFSDGALALKYYFFVLYTERFTCLFKVNKWIKCDLFTPVNIRFRKNLLCNDSYCYFCDLLMRELNLIKASIHDGILIWSTNGSFFLPITWLLAILSPLGSKIAELDLPIQEHLFSLAPKSVSFLYWLEVQATDVPISLTDVVLLHPSHSYKGPNCVWLQSLTLRQVQQLCLVPNAFLT